MTWKNRIILLIDIFDDRVLNHCLHPWLCGWIAEHPWWPKDNWKIEQAQDEIDYYSRTAVRPSEQERKELEAYESREQGDDGVE